MSTDEVLPLARERIQQSLDESPFQRPFRLRVLSLDSAGDYALLARLGHGVATIDLRIDYLRPASMPASSLGGGTWPGSRPVGGDF